MLLNKSYKSEKLPLAENLNYILPMSSLRTSLIINKIQNVSCTNKRIKMGGSRGGSRVRERRNTKRGEGRYI